jgi:hypothetical protein
MSNNNKTGFYAIRAESDGCEKCQSMDGKTFPYEQMMVGANYPPFHPNCRCKAVNVMGPETLDEVRRIFTRNSREPKAIAGRQPVMAARQHPVEEAKPELADDQQFWEEYRREHSIFSSEDITNINPLYKIADTFDSFAMSNYMHNRSIPVDLTKPINGQNIANGIASKMWMGLSQNSVNNDCGWIAIFNAQILLFGKADHPANIIYELENRDLIAPYGAIGVTPWGVDSYFVQRGCITSGIAGTKLNYSLVNDIMNPDFFFSIAYDNIVVRPIFDAQVAAADATILCYVHSSGAHYVTVEYDEEKKKFLIYNEDGGVDAPVERDSVYDYFYNEKKDYYTMLYQFSINKP